MEVKSSHDMDNGHFWALCPFEAPFPKHKKDSFWHEMPKKAYQTNLQWSSLLLWIWHKVFQLLFVELLTKLIGLFTTETPSSTADVIMQRVSFPPGKIHGFEVWLTSGTGASCWSKRWFSSPLENCILSRKWMALKSQPSSPLFDCPAASAELMMVCDQYFPYIYYFYTHLLQASQLNFQIAHRHALLFLPEKH